ncbi:Formamidopyrimidine-DNA glycosylase [uncultured archaeon]|nr:Formamidopyrimidine-DNA glycosylase [uncultured archaeon]
MPPLTILICTSIAITSFMPELPEVEMARRYLSATSLHQPIISAEVMDSRILFGISADMVVQSLIGQQFNSALRHGKRLFLELLPDLWLTLHLGLTGKLVYLNDRDEVPRHTRLLITFENERRLAFDDLRIFGEVGLTISPQRFLLERKIGPDVLEIDLAGFLKIMMLRRGIIKAALLNQHLVAGLGNLYADESLFQAGICPRSRALDEEHLKLLFCSIKKILSRVLSVRADLDMLPDSYLLPHRHPGGVCPWDKTVLRHENVVGRTSYYCPRHQKIVGSGGS